MTPPDPPGPPALAHCTGPPHPHPHQAHHAVLKLTRHPGAVALGSSLDHSGVLPEQQLHKGFLVDSSQSRRTCPGYTWQKVTSSCGRGRLLLARGHTYINTGLQVSSLDLPQLLPLARPPILPHATPSSCLPASALFSHGSALTPRRALYLSAFFPRTSRGLQTPPSLVLPHFVGPAGSLSRRLKR